MEKGLFIALEGDDGAGKTTAARRLVKMLEEEGIPAVLTREPGGTPISEQIRAILLNPENSAMTPETEALLYAASRTQHYREKIEPSLDRGITVLSDRFLDSSLAYQGYARGLGFDQVEAVNDFGLHHQRPDLVLFFSVPEEISRQRILQRGNLDRMDQESAGFHRKVSLGFRKLIEQEPERFVLIDASQTPEQTAADAFQAILDCRKRKQNS